MALSAYGYIFNNNTNIVAFGADILFSNHGELVGMSHALNSTDIIVAQAGIYAIDYTVTPSTTGVNSSLASAYAIAVNGATADLLFKTTFGQSITAGDQVIEQTLNGHVILTLPAGASVSLRNVGTTDFLPSNVDGVPIVNASLRLMKLN